MFADIAIDVPLMTAFTYRVPEALRGSVVRGGRVLVPFQRKTLVGVCLSVRKTYDEKASGVPESVLKEVSRADPDVLFNEADMRWLEFASEHYHCPVGQVFAQAIPEAYWDAGDFSLEKARKARAAAESDFPAGAATAPELTAAQAAVVADVSSNWTKFYPALLHGVTGSGKTEVYMALIRRVLDAGRSALYLVPEIGLTPQTLARLAARFAGRLMAFHSGLTPNRRLASWRAARGEEALVIVGTRSALFAPFRDLGLIVVDEEQDTSYKQEDRFRYHARDLAVARAKFLGVPVLLGSATPSLETYHLARQGQYRHFELTGRPGGADLPAVEIVDMAREREQSGLPLNVSRHITDAVARTLKDGAQAIVFAGQRGYAQNAWCTACAAAQICPNCSVGLKFHAPENALKCHYCGYAKPFDEVCLKCGAKALTLIGFGIQSVEEELKAALPPGARILRVDSDAFASPLKLEAALKSFAEGGIDVIVGTQMMSKGHDFPGVGFVGVVGLDVHLGLPDFRAAERCFQNLVQVAGRAGRRGKTGRVIAQSFFPSHPSLRHAIAHDYKAFAEAELAEREALGYPPFCRLAQIRVVSPSEEELNAFARRAAPVLANLRRQLGSKGIALLGPAEMPIYKLRGKFRRHLILKVPRRIKASDVVRYVLEGVERANDAGLQVQVDVDPVSLL